MLFHFGKFWKTVLCLVGSWGLYGLCGFEFTIVTLLAFIYAGRFKNISTII